MASVIQDPRRGTYQVQWFDGKAWRRKTVHRVPGWRPGKSAFPAREPLPVTRALAEYAALEAEARRGRVTVDPGLTVGDFLDAYEATYRAERAAGSVTQFRQARANFLAWCRPNRLARLEQVTPAACQRYLDWRAAQTSRKTGKPIAPARLAQERGLLMAAWSRAVRFGEIPANPWTSTRAPGWKKAKQARVRKPSWTPEEFERLLTACRPWLRDILTLGTQTGIRISALLTLTWRDIHWAPAGDRFGEIEVRPEADKAGKGYRVPISRRAHDLLARLAPGRSGRDDIVLAGERGHPVGMRNTAKAVIRACRKAGLPPPRSPNHHIRRSFGRWAILGHLTGRPIPLYVVSRWLGHNDPRTTLHYLDMTESESGDWMTEVAPAPTRNDSSGQDPVAT